jgi:cytochrome c oxidase subunit IV
MTSLDKYIDAYNFMGSSEAGLFFIVVMILVDIAEFFGISYELLNIIIIIVIPVLFIILLTLLIVEKFKNKRLNFLINDMTSNEEEK